MKKIIFLFTALLICSFITVKAQKYRFDTNENDPISGKRHRSISIIMVKSSLISNKHLYLGLDRNGEDFKLINNLALDESVDMDIAKGDSLFIKFDNNKLIKLYANISRPRVNGSLQGIPMTYYLSFYPLTIEDVQLLASANVVFIRIYINGMRRDQEIKEKYAIDMKNSAKLILAD
jgi:hypothetical protein